MHKKAKYILSLLAGLFLLSSQPVWAAGPPETSPFTNPLAITLVALMALLLIIIGVLANILIGTADIRLKKKKTGNFTSMAAVMVIGLLLFGGSAMAQGAAAPDAAPATSGVIGGLSSTTFYVLVSVIFLELFIIMALLINIKFLIKSEREKAAAEAGDEKVKKATTYNWWNKINSFRPVEQEADIDLGHDYDGIRELDNRLPPWWLYGFYITIIFAGIYLWRFHISHTAPLSKEEFETSVAKADAQIQDYLKKKGDAVDENNVVMLGADDIAAGKKIFTEPGLCNSCHGMDGSGYVMGNPGAGPNLTDDNWIHGGSIKNIFTTVKYGIDGKGMPEWRSRFSAKQLAQLASYVKSLRGTNPAQHKAPDGPIYVEQATVVKDSTGVKKDTVKVAGK